MRFLKFLCWFAVVIIAPAIFADTNTNAPFPVTITMDAAKPLGELKPIWRFFGADEPNYACMTDGKKLLSELGQLGGPQVYFRAHHLLTSGDGAYSLKFGSTSAYKEDTNGNAIYDWTINDKIFDTYLERGIKPYVQIGFMPEALSTHPQNYPHNPPVDKMAPVAGGQSYPPKDYSKWGELAYQWAKHCVEKYGADEVNKWYWEVWNEPNISYWHSSHANYFKLYDYAVAGVRRVAEEGIVLLKNENHTLPLDAAKIKSIAVIGENAVRLQSHGGESSEIKAFYEITPLQGLINRLSAAVGFGIALCVNSILNRCCCN